MERHEIGLDPARPEAVARRRGTGQRTARENVEDLCDPGSFVEYGPLVVAAQRRRRTMDDLIRNTPADGFITGRNHKQRSFWAREFTLCGDGL
jgi:acetyl-CoA carboxylase carboxyltransferase component